MDHATFYLVAFIIINLYFAPSWIAHHRHHRQRWPVYVVNLLLGWTLLGWLVALILAVSWTPRRRRAAV